MGRISNERANRIYYEAKQLKASMTEEDKAKRKEAQRYAPSEPSNKSAKTTSSASTSSPKANAKYVPMDAADNQYAQALAAFNPGGTFVPRAAQEEIAARKAANHSRYMDALDTSTRAGVAAAASGTVRPVMNTDETVAVRNEWAKKAAQDEADRQSAGREFRSARGSDEYRDRVGNFDSSAIPYGANNTGRIRYALDDDFRARLDTTNQGLGLLDPTYENLKYLNDFEKNDLANLVAQGDYNRANEYLDHLQPELNARMQGNVSAANKKLAEEQPVAGVLANIVGTREAGMALLPTIQGAINEEMGVYKPVDTNGSAFRAAHLLRDTTEGVGNAAYNAAGGGIAGDTARFLAEAGLSAAQNASMLPMGPTAPLVFMGSMAAGQSALDTLENGGTAQDALKVAVATGIIETATEKIGIENFFRISRLGKKGIQQLLKDYKLGKPLVNNIKSFAGDLGTQMAAESAEEMIAEVAGNLADTAIRGDNGQYAQLVQTYMANGMSEEQAKARAFTDMYIDNVLKAGAQGALAGGMLGVGGATIGTRYNNEVTAVGAELAELDITPQQLITAVQQSGSKDAQDFARELSRKLVLGQEVTLADMGQLHLLSNNYITSKDYEAVQKAAIAEETEARNAGGNLRESEQNLRESEAAAGVQQNAGNAAGVQQGDVASKATNNTESIEPTAGQETGRTLTVSEEAMASKLTEAERTEIERTGATPAIVKEDGKRVRVAWRGDNGTVAQKWFSQDEISYGETASVRGEKTAPVAVSGETAAAAPTVFAQGAQVQTPQGEGTVVMAADNTVAVRLANGTTEIFKTSDLSSAQANANENTALPQSANAQTATGNTAANAETNEANAEGRGETGTQSKTVAETSWENIQKIVQTKAKGGLSQKDEYTLNSVGRRTFDRIGRALGVEIHFVDRIVNEEGEANGLYHNGHIFIARNAENPYHVVLAHEITHHFEKTAPDVYEKFKSAALKMNPGLVEKYMARWGYDEATAEFEVTADFAGQLLRKEGAVKRVIKEDISAARGFHRAMNAVFDKVRGDDTKGLTEEEKKLDAQLDAARDMWRRCLRETRDEKAEGGESRAQFSRKRAPSMNDAAYKDLMPWNQEEYLSSDAAKQKQNFDAEVSRFAPSQQGIADRYNFFDNTIAAFKKVESRPHRKPDFVSKDRGGDRSSEYWYTRDGVIRGSDHWGRGIASCDWAIEYPDGSGIYGTRLGGITKTKKIYGKAKWSDFLYKTGRENITINGKPVQITFLNKVGKDTVAQGGRIYSAALSSKASDVTESYRQWAREWKNSDDPAKRETAAMAKNALEKARDTKDTSPQMSRKLTPEQRKLDEDYMAAVERGDMETAQRMVDKAAKAAGYDTPKLYHGTRAFGFTRFDKGKANDSISTFATDNPRTAETYSGETQRKRIKDRTQIDVDSLRGEELLREAKKQLKAYANFELMTNEARSALAEETRDEISYITTEGARFVNKNEDSFNDEQRKVLDRALNAISSLSIAMSEEAVEQAWEAFDDALWDLKWSDEDGSACQKFLDNFPLQSLHVAKNQLDDLLYQGDLFYRPTESSSRYVFDAQLALELDAELHKGIYELYGKSGKQLVVNANGANWNQIAPPEELHLYGPQNTRAIAAAAKAHDYDSVLFKNVRDNGGETPYNGESNVYIFFNPSVLKSADPATYDDDGNVIPLSERFNEKKDDIRFSRKSKQAETETLNSVGVAVDAKSESGYALQPQAQMLMQFSRKTFEASDYSPDSPNFKAAVKALARQLGVTQKQAKQFILDVNSVAATIAKDPARLDYVSAEGEGRSAFVSNAEYGGSIDFSTICPKRRMYMGTVEAIQKAMPDRVLSSDDILKIRSMMKDKGYKVACGFCYVEGSRAKLGYYTNKFRKELRDAGEEYVPTQAELMNIESLDRIRREHHDVYEKYIKFMNSLAQRKPKLFQPATEYNGEIIDKFGKDKDKAKVESKNLFGGLRIFSFSDFEAIHMIDMMQVVLDMARVGLAGQAYTKQPDFARVFGGTGIKINLSLVASGIDENGRLTFDGVEGMKIEDAMEIRDMYPDNVGTIVVTFTPEQLKAAMADDRIDFIIPFHRSQWNKSQYARLGLPADTKDMTYWQNERYLRGKAPTRVNKNGKTVRVKATNFMPNSYWNFKKDGKANAEAYLKLCAENYKKPKFWNLLVDNKDGSYSLQPDGSTDGYWKLLGDFKMYNHKTGKGVPQKPVKPDFNMTEANRVMSEYKGGHESFPVAQDVVDEFVSENGGKTNPQLSRKGQTLSPEFKRWFGDWQNDPENASKVVNKDGTPKVVYHQTARTFWTFDNSNPVAGRTDSETPSGFFFKENDHDIGVAGDVQMAVYLNMRNPLPFKDRKEANAWYCKHVKGYKEAQEAMKAALTPIEKNMDDLESRMFAEGIADEEYDRLDKEWNTLLEKMHEEEDGRRGSLHQMLNDYFLSGNSGYDGIILDNDGYARPNGRRTGEIVKSYIVFKRRQIKSATDNVGAFDRENPDIRYSRKGQDAAMRRANRLARENARLKGQFKLTKGVKLRESDIRKVTQDLLKDYEIIDFDKDELEGHIRAMAEAAQAADESNADKTWESIRNVARGLSRYVGRAAFARYADVDEEYDADLVRETYEDIRRHLGRQRVLSPWFKDPWVENESPQRKEMRDYYRRKLFGVLTLTSDRSVDKGPLDDIGKLYEELTETFGEAYFPSDVTNDEDQIIRIADVLDDLKDTLTRIGERTPMTVAEDVEQSSRDETRRAAYEDEVYGELYARLEEDILNRIAEVRREKPTFADKKKAEQYAAVERAIEQTQSKAEAAEIANRIEDAKKYRERIAKLEARLNKLKEENKGLKGEARQTQKDIREADTYYRQAAQEALREAKAQKREALQELKDKYKAKTAEARERQNARELRRKIEKYTKDLYKTLAKPTNEKHINEDVRPAAALLISLINQESLYTTDIETGKPVRPGAPPRLTDNGLPAVRIANKRTEAARKMRKAAEEIFSGEDNYLLVYDPELMENLAIMEDWSDKPLAAMSSAELQVVWDAVRGVKHMITQSRKVFNEGRQWEVGILASGLVRDVDLNNPRRTIKYGAAASVDKLLNIDQLPPQAYFHRFGEGGDRLFRMLRRSQDKYVRIIADIQARTAEVIKDIDIDKLNKDIATYKVKGGDVTLSRAQVLLLYASIKREQAAGHILGGGIKAKPLKGKGLFETKQLLPVEVTQEDLDNMFKEAKLTEAEKKAADGLVNIMSTVLAEYGNEASLRTYGYAKFREGWYVPIETDPTSNKTDNNDPLFKQFTAAASIAGRGFAKQTKEGAKNAIMVGSLFDVYAKHVNDMAMYAAYVETLENMRRVRNFKFKDGTKTQNYIEALLTQAGVAYWDKLINDINGGERLKNDDFSFDRFVGAYKAAAVSANIRVILQQPTAIIRAAAEINPAYLIAAMRKIPKRHEWDRVKKNSAIAQWKDWGYFDINTGRQMRDVVLGTDSLFEKFKQAGMRPMSGADSFAWTLLYHACEDEAKAKGLRPGGAAFDSFVASRFSDIIDKTQVVDGVLQRSQIMRSTNAVTKMATSFMAEPTKTYNMFLSAVWDFRHAKSKTERQAARKKLGFTAAALVVSFLVNAAAQSLIDALRDDDRDKEFLDKFLDAYLGRPEEDDKNKAVTVMGGNLWANFNPVTYIPFFKDIMSLVQGFDTKRMDMESIGRVIDAAEQALAAAKGEGKQTAFARALALASEVSRVCGLPLANIKRDSVAVLNTIAQEKKDYGMMYNVDRAFYKLDKNVSRYVDIMLKAHDSGDTETERRITDDLHAAGVDDKKIKDAADKIRVKQQGLDSVTELKDRYRPYEEAEEYGRLESYAKSTSTYKSANAKERSKYEALLNDALANNSDAQKRHEKAQKAGVSDNLYMEALVASQIADRTEGNNNWDKSSKPSQPEAEAAIDRLARDHSLSQTQKYNLWMSLTSAKTDKNNPYK